MNNEIKIITDTLAAENYELAFGIAGSGISYKLIHAMVENGMIYIPVSNESAAAIAAGAATYHNHKKSVCVSIKGPGFVNLLAGITACYFERFEVLSFSEDYDENTPHTKQHKRLNQLDMVKPVVNKTGSFNDIDSFDRFVRQEAGDEMPIHFELARPGFKYERISAITPSDLNTDQFTTVLSRIKKSEKPVLIIGSLLHRLEKTELLQQLNLPIFTTAQAKGDFDETRGNACGVYTGVGLDLVPENEFLAQSDCVITLGLRNYEILGVDNKSKFLNLDIINAYSDEHTTYCEKEQLYTVIGDLASKKNWCSNQIITYRKHLDKYVDSYEWMPGQVFKAINEIDSDITLVLDTGSFCTVGEHVFVANKNKRFIGSSNGRFMGMSIPVALGVSIESTPVICCCGDGGIRYHIGEIRTIIELNLPVCIILLSDRLYGSIACSINQDMLNDKIVKPRGMSWFKVIESMNVPAGLATTDEEFRSLLSSWNKRGPMFIEALFDTAIYSGITSNLRK